MRCLMIRVKHDTHAHITYICTAHHFLPIDTWSDCTAQHPTCGCIASVLCLAHSACFSSLMIQPTTLAPEHLLLRFVIYMISSLMVQPKFTFPLQRRKSNLLFLCSTTYSTWDRANPSHVNWVAPWSNPRNCPPLTAAHSHIYCHPSQSH